MRHENTVHNPVPIKYARSSGDCENFGSSISSISSINCINCFNCFNCGECGECGDYCDHDRRHAKG